MRHWDVLELAPTDDVKEIKRAYAKRLKLLDLSKEAAAFQVLRDAYEEALAAAKGVKREIALAQPMPHPIPKASHDDAVQPPEPDQDLEAMRQNYEKQRAMAAELAELVRLLMVSYGEKAWNAHARSSTEAGRRSLDGSLEWEKEVLARLMDWKGSPFPGAFAERFAAQAEIFRDIKFQRAHPYAFYIFYEKLGNYRSLLQMIRLDPKDQAWTYILAPRNGADHEKAARNMVVWAAVRRFLVTIEDEEPDMLHTMFHQDTLAFWQHRTRGVPPVWAGRSFLWGIWGMFSLPFILKVSFGWELQSGNAGIHILWTFAAGFFHRWLFYALANLLRYRSIGPLGDSLAKVLRRPKMRVACFVLAIVAIVSCYLVPQAWAGILPFVSLFAAWLALGSTYYQMAIPNGIIALICSADLIRRLPPNDVFLSTFVPFIYLSLGVLYFMRRGYARTAHRLPAWIPGTVRGIGLFIVSGLVLRFGLQLILSLTGS